MSTDAPEISVDGVPRRIVIGYDGTDNATCAAKEAVWLARAIGATLHIVTVVEDERLRQGMTTEADHERALEQAREQATELVSASLGPLIAGIETVVTATSGTAADMLVKYASDVHADLIVVGNRRVQGIERVLGSVAIAVLRRAPCSVYVAQTR